MTKVKITQKSTGISKVVSSEDAKAIKANKHLSNKYKFEAEAEKPKDPVMTKDSEVKDQKKNTKTNTQI